MLAVYLGFNVLCSSGNLFCAEVIVQKKSVVRACPEEKAFLCSDIFVEVVILKKLSAVLLLVFVASLFVTGAAFARAMVQVDANALGANVTVPANVGRVSTGAATLRMVSRDISVPYNATYGTTSYTDYQHLQFVSPDAGYFFNFPDAVIAILEGGVGNVPTVDGGTDVTGYTVSSNRARAIARLVSANPADAVATEAGIASVYVWSADLATFAAGVNVVAVPVTINQWTSAAGVVTQGSNRFNGLRVSDIRAIKVRGDIAGAQHDFKRIYRAADIEPNTFLVTRYNSWLSQDIILGANDVIVANSNVTDDDPYRIILFVRDGDANFDFSTTGTSDGVVIDPVVVVAENPFVKTPDIIGTFSATTQALYGWKVETRTGEPLNAERAQPYAIVAPATTNNSYTANVRNIMGSTNRMVWITTAGLTSYGFDAADVHLFPATITQVAAAQNTAVVLYTIRDLGLFAGRTPSEVRVINANGENFATPMEYTLATTAAGMTDGHFAIMKPDATDRHRQVFVAADEEIVAGGVYFLALAAKDGGDYDVSQGNQGAAVGKNDTFVHFFAFATVGEAPVPSVTPSETPSVAPSVTPSQAPVSGGSSGGCSVGSFAPAAVILLAPLFLLLKK